MGTCDIRLSSTEYGVYRDVRAVSLQGSVTTAVGYSLTRIPATAFSTCSASAYRSGSRVQSYALIPTCFTYIFLFAQT